MYSATCPLAETVFKLKNNGPLSPPLKYNSLSFNQINIKFLKFPKIRSAYNKSIIHALWEHILFRLQWFRILKL